MESNRYRTSISLSQECLDWINKEIKHGRFSYITQALENMIYNMIKWQQFQPNYLGGSCSIPTAFPRVKVSIHPRKDIFDILDVEIEAGRFLNRSDAFEKLTENMKKWDEICFNSRNVKIQ